MPFSLGDRQAISMRANAASEHGIAIDVKVVRCDRGRDRRRTTGYKFRRFDRRYMLTYDLEVGQFAHERREDRKSVVEGKSGSVRVDVGGRRLIKKKKKI